MQLFVALVIFALISWLDFVVHELGHWAVALLLAIRPVRISMGNGICTWAGKRGTLWSFGPPATAYFVAYHDEDGLSADKDGSWLEASPLRRAAVYLAGGSSEFALGLGWAILAHSLREAEPECSACFWLSSLGMMSFTFAATSLFPRGQNDGNGLCAELAQAFGGGRSAITLLKIALGIMVLLTFFGAWAGWVGPQLYSYARQLVS